MMRYKKLLMAFILSAFLVISLPINIHADTSFAEDVNDQNIVEVMPDINLRRLFATMMGLDSVDDLSLESLDGITSISLNPENLHFFDVVDFTGIELMDIQGLYVEGLDALQTKRLMDYDFSSFAKLKNIDVLYIARNIFSNGLDFNHFTNLLNSFGSIFFADNTIVIDKELSVQDYQTLEFTTKDWGLILPKLGVFEFSKVDNVSVFDTLSPTDDFYISNSSEEEYAYLYEEDSHYDSDKTDESAHIFVPSDTYRFLWNDTPLDDLEVLLKDSYTSTYEDGIEALQFGTGTTYYDGNINYTFADVRFHLNVKFTHQSDVTIHYVDELGNSIADDIVLQGDYDTPFSIDVPEIDLYQFERIEERTKPDTERTNYNFTFENREFNVVYSKKSIINKYSVSYTDGVDNEVIFEDQVYSEIIENSKTPEFIGAPSREGYKFTGWNPEIADTVTQDAVYTAQWEKLPVPVKTFTVIYTDGVESEVIFDDQVYSDIVENSNTPVFEGTPIREGYTFLGWTPNIAATVTEDAVYTADWKIIDIEDVIPDITPDVPVEEALPNTGVKSSILMSSCILTLSGYAILSTNRKKNKQ
ncbi:MucBP domain-containing protein [Erysipelothrix sp. HDW6A]|uniref:MucBP domain-containing protein n=1 Tax=Erysipelothrix sp. HDW6A TaxID=2714928 RepID=UPI001409AD52|nr:MucBP domain-containing protein [Erysipelothrix sp. HDW6A]QIK58112.1 MucBP domain-containing protein [Erysipelothrix sp. HDW6A]